MLRYAARRVLSSAASRAVEASSPTSEYNLGSGFDVEEPIVPNPHLCLFPSPKVVVPNFELTRRLGTFLSQGIYQLCYEKAYNLERFILAANEGASVLGECIANEEWNRMSVVASTDVIEEAKFARRRFARNLSPLGQWKATAVNFFSLDEASKSQ
ncbi:hypothetical protein TELCIR_09313 [Teladorsagia circumcincta]|uniref:Uncharacterized protein n=1 Tax=Teladorsagia circumcincta TaxID=45464 RepID=A0A2G9UFE3_TELCI|nr:hypothetical protein TELCIR_09313 [Teladorsagia circumcincta]